MSNPTPIVRALFVGSLLMTATAFAIGASRDPSGRWLPQLWSAVAAIVIACLAAGAFFLIPWLQRRGRPVQFFVSLAALNLFAVFPEAALRAASFHHEFGIEFGWPRTTFRRALVVPDDALFWRLRPGARNFMNDDQTINALGFPGDEPVLPKPPGTYRVLYLGDSCTQQGYPSLVEAILNDARRPRRLHVDSAVLAAAGYSSYQGRLLADTYGTRWSPDLAVVYYGWNDHWQAYGARDAIKGARPTASKGELGAEIADLRVIQAFEWLMTGGRDVHPLEEPRVSPAEFKENLLAIHRRFAAIGVPVVFVTAPTAMPRVGVPDFLIDNKFARSKEQALQVHEEYSEIVRAVAAETKSTLVDLEHEFGAMTDFGLFEPDAIHFTRRGAVVAAELVAAAVEPSVPEPQDRP